MGNFNNSLRPASQSWDWVVFVSRFVRRRNCDSDIAVTFSTCPPTASWGDHLRKEFGDCTKYQADVIVGNTIDYSIYYIYIYIQCLNISKSLLHEFYKTPPPSFAFLVPNPTWSQLPARHHFLQNLLGRLRQFLFPTHRRLHLPWAVQPLDFFGRVKLGWTIGYFPQKIPNETPQKKERRFGGKNDFFLLKNSVTLTLMFYVIFEGFLFLDFEVPNW